MSADHGGTPRATEQAMGGRVAAGTAWMVGQSLAIKVLGLVAQVVIARILLEQDFGLFGLCLAFSSIATLIRSGGVQQVLVQRGRRFHLWAGPAFWLTMMLSLVGSVFLVVAGPIASAVYDEPALTPLLLVLALEPPLSAIGLLPRTKLMHELRFRTLMWAQGPAEVLRVVALIAFAMLGFGAMSFVLARLVFGVASNIVLWSVARPGVRLRPRFTRFKSLFADSGYSFGSQGIYQIIAQADKLILGLFASASVVGIYYFAFNLSLQAVGLFTTNLQQVFLPALSRLKDEPARQWDACVRGSRVMALVAGGICALQFAASPTAVPLLFGERWRDAVAILQLLTPALLIRLVWPIVGVRLQGRRDFRGVFFTRCVTGPFFVVAVSVGAWLDGADGAAIGCGCLALLEILLLYRRATGSVTRAISSVQDVLAGPALAGDVGGVEGILVGAWMSKTLASTTGILVNAWVSYALASNPLTQLLSTQWTLVMELAIVSGTSIVAYTLCSAVTSRRHWTVILSTACRSACFAKLVPARLRHRAI